MSEPNNVRIKGDGATKGLQYYSLLPKYVLGVTCTANLSSAVLHLQTIGIYTYTYRLWGYTPTDYGGIHLHLQTMGYTPTSTDYRGIHLHLQTIGVYIYTYTYRL